MAPLAWQPGRVPEPPHPRRLLLLRHAKSSWADAGIPDHDRPLNGRGRAAAAAMGEYLRSADLVPDLVLCSSARRACETLARLRLPADVVVDVAHDLYLADPGTVVDQVRLVDDAVATLLVVGHNPTTEELALDLAGPANAGAAQRISAKYPTGALAVLDVAGQWRDVALGTLSLTAFVTPSDLV